MRLSVRNFLPYGVLIIGIFILCAPLFNVGYFADDYDFLRRDLTVRDAFLKNTDGTAVGGSWRPLTVVSYAITMTHGASIALYAALMCIVLLIARHVWPEPSSRWRTFFVVAWISALAIHVEPVGWIASRADLLAALFALGALYAWLRGYAIVTLVLFACSLLSKEMWILLPLILLVVPAPIAPQRKQRALIAACILVGVWLAIRYTITNYSVGGYNVASASLEHHAAEAIRRAAMFGFGVFTWGDFQATLVRWASAHAYIAGAMVIFAALAVWRKTPAGYKWVMVGLFATLAPILLLEVPFYSSHATVQDQRYWFAPSIFAALAIYARIHKNRRAAVFLMIMFVIAMVGFRFNVGLYEDAARVRNNMLATWPKNIVGPHTVLFATDTYRGVHIAASPFFEQALEHVGFAVPQPSPWYRVCLETCEASSFDISTSTIRASAAQHTFLHLGERGLKTVATIERDPLQTYVMWSGESWIQLPPTINAQ